MTYQDKRAGDIYNRSIDGTIRAIAEREMQTVDPAHGFDHVRRVVDTATQIAVAEEAEVSVVRAAAWMHDLVTLPKDNPLSHTSSVMSAKAAAGILSDLGLSLLFVGSVAHAIEAHSFSAGIEPETLEARILRDADRIDALGAIGIARCFAVSGSIGRPLFHPDDPLAKERSANPSAWCLDTFPSKIFPRIEGVTTETGRMIAEGRLQYMKEFMTRVGDELNDFPVPEFGYEEDRGRDS
ncbi:HD domain-containing protein [Roseibium sp. RKSG952]|uniref:HD domain-containing protein n=1 Tax=Roseibium sp. RKSG952 TaxID=2529384 RepID=UPI0012BBC0D3|nr:HD domain-containing protein [Roseibium sp. RKSG952]MTH95491.1 HD domain-containing protein [Roseibium sp. RKSG952]